MPAASTPMEGTSSKASSRGGQNPSGARGVCRCTRKRGKEERWHTDGQQGRPVGANLSVKVGKACPHTPRSPSPPLLTSPAREGHTHTSCYARRGEASAPAPLTWAAQAQGGWGARPSGWCKHQGKAAHATCLQQPSSRNSRAAPSRSLCAAQPEHRQCRRRRLSARRRRPLSPPITDKKPRVPSKPRLRACLQPFGHHALPRTGGRRTHAVRQAIETPAQDMAAGARTRARRAPPRQDATAAARRPPSASAAITAARARTPPTRFQN